MSKILLYCTKAKPYLYRQDDDCFELLNKLKNEDTSSYKKYYRLNNGKIVAECDFEVEELRLDNDDPLGAYWYETETLNKYEVLEKSCLTDDELFDYLGEYEPTGFENAKQLCFDCKCYDGQGYRTERHYLRCCLIGILYEIVEIPRKFKETQMSIFDYIEGDRV